MKLIVAACNAATAAALPALQEALRVPVVGVLAPEAHAAVQATRNRRIGLLATEATVASGRYEEVVHALDAGAVVVSVACPKLVPLIEAGVVGEELDAAVREYAAPLKEEDVDTVILGCTHYPMIRRVFERAFGRGTTLVFSADETAREVAETLGARQSRTIPPATARHASSRPDRRMSSGRSGSASSSSRSRASSRSASTTSSSPARELPEAPAPS